MTRALLIPAAGAGTRLRSDRPKALTPVNGRPMLEYLLDLHRPFVDSVVVVASPAGERPIREYLATRVPRAELVVQGRPTGMLDAIRSAEPVLARISPAPAWIWVTWCDQVAVRPGTVERLAAACSHNPTALAVLPTVMRDDPYIHLERDQHGRIRRILMAREGDVMPPKGEGDLGLFALSARAYFDLLPAFDGEARTAAGTGERNFLPFLPWLEDRGVVVTFAAEDPIESVGINTPEELALVEDHLRDA